MVYYDMYSNPFQGVPRFRRHAYVIFAATVIIVSVLNVNKYYHIIKLEFYILQSICWCLKQVKLFIKMNVSFFCSGSFSRYCYWCWFTAVCVVVWWWNVLRSRIPCILILKLFGLVLWYFFRWDEFVWKDELVKGGFEEIWNVNEERSAGRIR